MCRPYHKAVFDRVYLCISINTLHDSLSVDLSSIQRQFKPKSTKRFDQKLSLLWNQLQIEILKHCQSYADCWECDSKYDYYGDIVKSNFTLHDKSFS